ncbi:unnamed protein product, partial [Prorocentrum cordatum]
MLEFGETVVGKEHTELQDKLGTAWCKGMRLGRSTKSDAHIIGTATGIVQARAAKQLTKEESFDTEILRAMRWTPWKTPVRAGVFDGENWQPTEGCPGREYAAKGQHGRGRPPHHSRTRQQRRAEYEKTVASKTEEQPKVVAVPAPAISSEAGLVGAIEDMSTEGLKRLVAGFSAEEMMRLAAEVDKETKDDSEFSVMGWTEDGEWEAKQRELDRFNNYDVWELTLRGPHGPKALTWTWVLEMRSGELKARLCAKPFGKQINKSKNKLHCPTPLSFSLKLLMAHAIAKAEVPREYCHLPDSSDWVFKLNKTVYVLDEAMIDFDDHFENIATGRSDESKMACKRCLADPCTFADKTNQGIQVRMRPASVKKPLDSEPNDKKTSPIPGIENERKVESEEELDAKAAARFRSNNGLNTFACLERPECQYAAQ